MPLLLQFLLSIWVLKPVPVTPDAYARLQQLFPSQPDTLQVYQTGSHQYWIEALYPQEKLVWKLSAREYRRFLAGLPLDTTRTIDRLAYVGGQTVVALSIYPWAVPTALTPEAEDPTRGAVALGLISPLLWSVGSAVYAWRAPVTLAQGYAGFWGGVIGAFHGGNIINSARGCFLGSVTGNLLNQYLARRYDLSLGAIQRLANGQIYGYYHYLMLESLLHLTFEAGSLVPHRIATTLSVAEGYADLFLSRNDATLTLGDALFELRTAIIGGELLPALLLSYDLARDTLSSPRLYAGLSLAGNAAGMVLGRYLSRRYDLSVPGALLTYLVPSLAHTFTSGLMVLLRPDPAVYPVLFIGTEVGITALTYRLVRQVPARRFGLLQHLAPFAQRSTLPGQGPVLGLQVSF